MLELNLLTAVMGYVGPGAGMGLGGALVGVLIALLTAVSFMLVWPVRMLIRKLRGQLTQTAGGAPEAPEGSTPGTPAAG